MRGGRLREVVAKGGSTVLYMSVRSSGYREQNEQKDIPFIPKTE